MTMPDYRVVLAPNWNGGRPSNDVKWVVFDNTGCETPVICDTLDEVMTVIKTWGELYVRDGEDDT